MPAFSPTHTAYLPMFDRIRAVPVVVVKRPADARVVIVRTECGLVRAAYASSVSVLR